MSSWTDIFKAFLPYHVSELPDWSQLPHFYGHVYRPTATLQKMAAKAEL